MKYDEHPVLPGEAKSLPTHVENCAIRYNSLQRVLSKIRLEMRLYTLANIALMGAGAWMLNKLLEKVP